MAHATHDTHRDAMKKLRDVANDEKLTSVVAACNEHIEASHRASKAHTDGDQKTMLKATADLHNTASNVAHTLADAAPLSPEVWSAAAEANGAYADALKASV